MNTKTVLTCLLVVVCTCFADTLTLPEAQKLLISNNRDVQIAEMRFLKSMAEVSEAKSAYYPTAETFANYRYQSKVTRLQTTMDMSPLLPGLIQALGLTPPAQQRQVITEFNGPIGDYDNFEWGADVTYPLFTGFTRRNAVLSQQAASTVSCLSFTNVKDKLAVWLGILYFNWELAVKKLDMQQVYIEQASEYLVQVQNQYQGGIQSRAKVLEASARLEAAKVELLSAQNSVDSIRLELLDLLRSSDTSAMPREYSYELPESVINSRPNPYRTEIEMLDSSLSVLRLNERVLFGRRLPSLVAFAGYRVGNPGIIMGGDDFIDWGIAGLQFRWTLYDGQKNWAQRDQLNQEISILKKEREKQLAMWEKNAALYRLQIEKARRMKAAAALSLQAAQSLAEDLRNTLAAGVTSPTEYLNALAAVSLAHYRVAQAEMMRKSMSVQLAYALGEKIEY